MNETLETTVLIILSVVNLQLLLITPGTINTNQTHTVTFVMEGSDTIKQNLTRIIMSAEFHNFQYNFHVHTVLTSLVYIFRS